MSALHDGGALVERPGPTLGCRRSTATATTATAATTAAAAATAAATTTTTAATVTAINTVISACQPCSVTNPGQSAAATNTACQSADDVTNTTCQSAVDVTNIS